jgi:hypothetical protein
MLPEWGEGLRIFKVGFSLSSDAAPLPRSFGIGLHGYVILPSRCAP